MIELNHSINTSGTSTRFQWVPSHVGLSGNERADRLAKEALDQPIIRIQVNKESMEIYQEIDGISRARWQRYWDDCLLGRHFYAIQKEVGNETRYPMRMSRKDETAITRLRLGRCKLNYYLHAMKCHPDGTCDTRGQQETIRHLLMECQDHSTLHFRLNEGTLQNTNELHQMLSSEQSINIIVKYVRENEELSRRI